MVEQNTSSLLLIYTTGIVSTLFIVAVSFFVILKNAFLIGRARVVFICSIILYFAGILTFQLLKLHTFKYYGDFAIWLELFSNIVDDRGVISTLEETSFGHRGVNNFFALHFVPLIYLLALPLYIFKNYPVYIIVLQTLILTSSVIPVYLFSRDIFNNKRIGYLFAASILFFPAIQYINLYDFEFLRISIPLLLFSFYFIHKRKTIVYFVFFILSVLVREEVALTTFLLGFYIFFVLKEKKIGLITSAVSISYFFFVTKVAMPYFAGASTTIHHHLAFGNFSYMGNSPSQIVIYIVSHPLAIISNLLNKIKIANFLMYVLPLCFTSFFSPAIFFIATANLLLNFLSVSISHYSYILYYLSPSIPFLFLSAIQGVKNIRDRWLPFLKDKNVLPGKFDNDKFTYALVSCIFVACVSSNIFFGPSFLSIQFWNHDYKLAPYKTHNFHYSQYIPTEHHAKAFSFLPLIPNNAIVSAEHFFLPYLYGKKALMNFPIYEGADYVLIDKTHPIKFGTIGVDPIEARKNPQQFYDLVEKDTNNWELIKEDDGVFLFKKRQWN